MFFPAPQQVSWLVPAALRRLVGSLCEGLPACPALGGQRLCIRSSSLCISTPDPARLETRPRQLQFPSMPWKPLVQDTGSVVPAASGSGWKREGVRGKGGPPPTPCQGQSWGEGVRRAAVCSYFNLSTSLGVRVCYPPVSVSVSLKHQLCLQGSGPRRDPGRPCPAVTWAEGREAASALSEARLRHGRLTADSFTTAVTGVRQSSVRASQHPVLLCPQHPCRIHVPVLDGSSEWRRGVSGVSLMTCFKEHPYRFNF